MRRARILTLPFHCPFGIDDSNRMIVSSASHSFWWQRYPQQCGPPCNNEIEKKLVSEKMVQKMWRAWLCTLPFYHLLGNVVGDRAMVLPASHSFWGQRYPLLCGPHCNDEIEKNKNQLLRKWCRKCGGHVLVPCPFIKFLVMLLVTGQWCYQLPIHSGGGDISKCADHPATMKLK